MWSFSVAPVIKQALPVVFYNESVYYAGSSVTLGDIFYSVLEPCLVS